MKIINLILLGFFCVLALMNCSKENNSNESFDVIVDIRILDKDSCDLLNPNNMNSYKGIALYKDSGLKERRFDSDLVPYQSENYGDTLYYLSFAAPMDTLNNGKYCATSYLKLNETTVDTIYTEITDEVNWHHLTKVVYNGKKVGRLITVIK